MPTKDPNVWVILLAMIKEHWQSIYCVLLTISLAWFRKTSNGVTGRSRVLESLLCGLLWLPAWGLLRVLGVPEDFAGPLASMVGFIGVETIRDLLVRFLGNKAGEVE